jgi:hypothetical protein
MARKASKKSAKKKKKTLKLRKKPLRDLPVRKKKTAAVKGGTATLSSLSPSQTAQRAFAPPYVPVGPVVIPDQSLPPSGRPPAP